MEVDDDNYASLVDCVLQNCADDGAYDDRGRPHVAQVGKGVQERHVGATDTWITD